MVGCVFLVLLFFLDVVQEYMCGMLYNIQAKIRKTNSMVWYVYNHKCLVTKYKYILMMEKLIENNYYSINNNIYDCTPSRKNRSKRCEKEKP